jgi:hypothetical protein
MDLLKLSNEIAEESGIGHGEWPRITSAAWFPDPAGAPTIWVIGKPSPMNASIKVYAIFDDGDDYNVYCVGETPGKGDTYHRYVLHKKMPLFTLANMSLGVFKDEIVGEIHEVMGVDPDDDDDGLACIKCGEENDVDAKFCGACGQGLVHAQTPAPTAPTPPPAS